MRQPLLITVDAPSSRIHPAKCRVPRTQTRKSLKALAQRAFQTLEAKGYFTAFAYACCRGCVDWSEHPGHGNPNAAWIFDGLYRTGATYLNWSGDPREIIEAFTAEGFYAYWDERKRSCICISHRMEDVIAAQEATYDKTARGYALTWVRDALGCYDTLPYELADALTPEQIDRVYRALDTADYDLRDEALMSEFRKLFAELRTRAAA